MAELFDTTRVPDDAAHWDALAERIAAAAARSSQGRTLPWCAQSRARWVAASLLLAAALAFLVLPSEDWSSRRFTLEWVQALAPADEVGRAITLPEVPPAIGALLLGDQGGGVR